MIFISTLKNWVWLSLCISYKNISRVLERFATPENVMIAQQNELLEILTKAEVEKILQRDFTQTNQILEQCFNKEITIISINDSTYPDLLRNINNPPIVLYIKGRLPDIDTKIGISIVGTRSASAYGQIVTKKLSYALAKSGILIISGMATGIDSIANQSAILAGAPTIAVLGCSVDVCYPRENRVLMDNIMAVGALISEFPPTTEPYRNNFPQRNRIMSGISRGTLVIEAPKKSGALITASYALEQDRDIFAIPGNIDNPNAYGCNELIKIGAKMVTCVGDVIEEYIDEIKIEPNINSLKNKFNIQVIEKEPEKQFEKKPPKPVEKKSFEKKARQNMSDKEKAIYNIVLDGIDTVDKIIEESNLSTPEVMSMLTMLEINGDITRHDNRIKIKEN